MKKSDQMTGMLRVAPAANATTPPPTTTTTTTTTHIYIQRACFTFKTIKMKKTLNSPSTFVWGHRKQPVSTGRTSFRRK